MQHHFDNVQDQYGNAVGGVSVLVSLTSSGARATVYSDNGVNAKTNPLTTSATGGVDFYAANGDYTLTVTHADGTTSQAYATLFDVNDVNATAIGFSQLAASTGSSLIGYDGGTLQDVADSAKPMQSYAALRAYTGCATGARITSSGVSGFFARSLTDTTSADNGGTILCDGLGRRWKRLYEGAVHLLWFIPQAEHAAIISRTSTFDCYSAIIAAINVEPYDAAGYGSCTAVYVHPGLYNCGTSIELKRAVRIYGDGNGQPYQIAAATLKFPAGVSGITVNRFNTINGGVESPTTTAADASTIEGIVLLGSAGSTAYGIYLRARAVVKNCLVSGFSGVGIQVIASSGAGGASEGNANNFRIDGGRVESCGSHGIFIEGADANAGYVIGIDCSNNGGFGFYDSSFLGNTYVACHTAGNSSGSYKTDNVNARNVLTGCYSEPGQPAASLVYPTIVIGGLHGAGVSGTCMQIRDGVISGLAFTDAANASFSPCSITDAAYSFKATGDATRWYWKKVSSSWCYSYANGSGTKVPFEMEYSGAVDQYGSDGVKLKFQLGYFVGYSTSQRFRTVGSAAPVSGTWKRGDIVENQDPSAGGFIGWVCTTAGTPGTWKTFGVISA